MANTTVVPEISLTEFQKLVDYLVEYGIGQRLIAKRIGIEYHKLVSIKLDRSKKPRDHTYAKIREVFVRELAGYDAGLPPQAPTPHKELLNMFKAVLNRLSTQDQQLREIKEKLGIG